MTKLVTTLDDNNNITNNTKERKMEKPIYIYDTKTTKNGHVVSIFGCCGGNYFAGGKKYWIAFGEPKFRNAINQSDSLAYISKKFKEIR